MRTRTGHGPDDWSPNVPAQPLNVGGWFHGSLAVPAPRPGPKLPLTANQTKLDDRPVVTGRPRKPLTDVQTAARRAAWRAYKRRKREAA